MGLFYKSKKELGRHNMIQAEIDCTRLIKIHIYKPVWAEVDISYIPCNGLNNLINADVLDSLNIKMTPETRKESFTSIYGEPKTSIGHVELEMGPAGSLTRCTEHFEVIENLGMCGLISRLSGAV